MESLSEKQREILVVGMEASAEIDGVILPKKWWVKFWKKTAGSRTSDYKPKAETKTLGDMISY
jgi:hypothetical protein